MVPQVCRAECRLMCRIPAAANEIGPPLAEGVWVVGPSRLVACHIVAVAVCSADCEAFFGLSFAGCSQDRGQAIVQRKADKSHMAPSSPRREGCAPHSPAKIVGPSRSASPKQFPRGVVVQR